MNSGAATAIARCEHLESDDARASSRLEEDWLLRVRQIAPALAELGTDAERVGLLIGCAVVFARKAGLTEEQFAQIAEDGWTTSCSSFPPSD